jgi:hypothetical protein
VSLLVDRRNGIADDFAVYLTTPVDYSELREIVKN